MGRGETILRGTRARGDRVPLLDVQINGLGATGRAKASRHATQQVSQRSRPIKTRPRGLKRGIGKPLAIHSRVAANEHVTCQPDGEPGCPWRLHIGRANVTQARQPAMVAVHCQSATQFDIGKFCRDFRIPSADLDQT